MVLTGGSGINTFSVTGGTAVLQGGSGSNTFSVTGGTVALHGGSGSNTFTLNGPGTYTVIGQTGATNALTINFNDNNASDSDSIYLTQSGSTITLSGTIAGTTIAGTATNMTSVSVNGGKGPDKLNAYGMIMGVTLNGGSGRDNLTGGMGSDTLYYCGNGSSYDGGPGGANDTLIYPAAAGDNISFWQSASGTPGLAVNPYYSPIGDSSFESPVVVDEQDQPTGTPWQFGQHCGIYVPGPQGYSNGDRYPFDDAAYAPNGTQVAFISGGDSISQSVHLDPGVYSLSLYAAQTVDNLGDGTPWDYVTDTSVQVLVDGVAIGGFLPDPSAAGSNMNWGNPPPFMAYTTPTFEVSNSGTHTIELAGVNAYGYPDSDPVVVDAVSLSLQHYLPNRSWTVNRIENFQVTGSPASVNNTQQLIWPVDPYPLTNATISPLTATAGSPITTLTAGFTDPNPNASASTDTATINWGNGTTSSGTVTASGGGNFTITASHIYVNSGTQPTGTPISATYPILTYRLPHPSSTVSERPQPPPKATRAVCNSRATATCVTTPVPQTTQFSIPHRWILVRGSHLSSSVVRTRRYSLSTAVATSPRSRRMEHG